MIGNRIGGCLKKNVDTIGVALLMLAIFSYIMFAIGDDSDLQAHAIAAKKKLEENRLFEDNFLMYFIVNLLSGFTGSLLLIKVALVGIIALSNTIKYVLTKESFARICQMNQAKMASGALLFVYIVPALYFMKLFGARLNDHIMYLGYYVPNVWHNSTILCMMPFAIISFFLSVRQFDNYDRKRNGLITLSVVFGTLVKPSFFFVYMIAYPICMFAKYRFRKEFFYSLLPIVAGIICVLFEYLCIFSNEFRGTYDDNNVAINVVQLFGLKFWGKHYLKLFISLIFPLLFLAFYWRYCVEDMEFWFVLIMLIVAIGIWWCCKETGSREFHGNFSWQVISAMWFVYYYILKMVLKRNIVNNTNTTSLFLSLYAIHVIMGILFLVRFLITHNYD